MPPMPPRRIIITAASQSISASSCKMTTKSAQVFKQEGLLFYLMQAKISLADNDFDVSMFISTFLFTFIVISHFMQHTHVSISLQVFHFFLRLI